MGMDDETVPFFVIINRATKKIVATTILDTDGQPSFSLPPAFGTSTIAYPAGHGPKATGRPRAAGV